MELIEAFKGSAVVELAGPEQFLLQVGLHRAMDLMEYWNEFVEQTGYEGHSFHYLYDWLSTCDPRRLDHPGFMDSAERAAKRLESAVPADRMLATQVEVGGVGLPDRFSFTRDAFGVFESAIREVLDEGAKDDFYVLRNEHVKVEELRRIRRQILAVVAAMDASGSGDVDPRR